MCTQTQARPLWQLGCKQGQLLSCLHAVHMLTTILLCCVTWLQEAIQEHPYPLSAATHKLMGGLTSAKTAVQQVPKQAAQHLAASKAASTQQQQQKAQQKKLLSPRGVSHLPLLGLLADRLCQPVARTSARYRASSIDACAGHTCGNTPVSHPEAAL